MKVPITIAADDKFYDIFLDFGGKYNLIFHVNHLPAGDSHEISSINWFLKAGVIFENVVCCKYLMVL